MNYTLFLIFEKRVEIQQRHFMCCWDFFIINGQLNSGWIKESKKNVLHIKRIFLELEVPIDKTNFICRMIIEIFFFFFNFESVSSPHWFLFLLTVITLWSFWISEYGKKVELVNTISCRSSWHLEMNFLYAISWGDFFLLAIERRNKIFYFIIIRNNIPAGCLADE